MPENYEVIYTHPGGATATFIRQGGELDALAKGLDAEQFWVFKQVKALLVRNDAGDLDEANRLMASVGFTAHVRELVAPQPVRSTSELRDQAFAGAAVAAAQPHAGPHLPAPSYWPLFTGISILIALSGLIVMDTTLVITGIGLVLVFICLVSWGLEPIEGH
jgi:hypothetical protein